MKLLQRPRGDGVVGDDGHVPAGQRADELGFAVERQVGGQPVGLAVGVVVHRVNLAASSRHAARGLMSYTVSWQ
jgi:hypothetical protein